MRESKGQKIKCSEAEEHFLRRLGGAAIVLWDEFPEDMKQLLIHQSADMLDRHQMTSADFQIKEFIEKHKGGDISASRS